MGELPKPTPLEPNDIPKAASAFAHLYRNRLRHIGMYGEVIAGSAVSAECKVNGFSAKLSTDANELTLQTNQHLAPHQTMTNDITIRIQDGETHPDIIPYKIGSLTTIFDANGLRTTPEGDKIFARLVYTENTDYALHNANMRLQEVVKMFG